MKKNKDHISTFCDHCEGSGDVSYCCDFSVVGKQCSGCFKFTKKTICSYCEGTGNITYHLGQEVYLLLSQYSTNEIKKFFIGNRKIKESKVYEGMIKKINDSNHVTIKFKNKPEIKLNIDNIFSY